MSTRSTSRKAQNRTKKATSYEEESVPAKCPKKCGTRHSKHGLCFRADSNSSAAITSTSATSTSSTCGTTSSTCTSTTACATTTSTTTSAFGAVVSAAAGAAVSATESDVDVVSDIEDEVVDSKHNIDLIQDDGEDRTTSEQLPSSSKSYGTKFVR